MDIKLVTAVKNQLKIMGMVSIYDNFGRWCIPDVKTALKVSRCP